MINRGVCPNCNKFPARRDISEDLISHWICQLCWLQEEAFQRYYKRGAHDIENKIETRSNEMNFTKRMLDAVVLSNIIQQKLLSQSINYYLKGWKALFSVEDAHDAIQQFYFNTFVCPQSWFPKCRFCSRFCSSFHADVCDYCEERQHGIR